MKYWYNDFNCFQTSFLSWRSSKISLAKKNWCCERTNNVWLLCVYNILGLRLFSINRYNYGYNNILNNGTDYMMYQNIIYGYNISTVWRYRNGIWINWHNRYIHIFDYQYRTSNSQYYFCRCTLKEEELSYLLI